MAGSTIKRSLWFVTRAIVSLFAALIGTFLFVVLALGIGDGQDDAEAFLTLFAMTWICLRVWAVTLKPGQTERWGRAVLLAVLFPGALTALPFYVVLRLCGTDRVVRWLSRTRRSSTLQPSARVSSTEAILVIVALLASIGGLVGSGVWGHQAFAITAFGAAVLVFIWIVVRLL